MNASKSRKTSSRPNILLIVADQYRFPRFSYGPTGGFAESLKRILGFQGDVGLENPYAKFFPGLLRLRKNAVVLRNHTIAASACTPSRAAIFTGQYGTRTGVTQTDGLFKDPDAPNFPWLAADGIPTLGSWMREAGYTTHYFGKWHVSNPASHSLDQYGFDDWELSYPEPHGAMTNNLGVYRDFGFADTACAFIRRKGLAVDYDRAAAARQYRRPYAQDTDVDEQRPWFAVASFANPHDIATYPAVISQVLPSDSPTGTQSVFGPLTVPAHGEVTPPPTAGTMRIHLNPLGFPQDCANPPPTQNESLAGKPTCQYDYAYKMGLALGAKTAAGIAGDKQAAIKLALKSSVPFNLADDPQQSALLFIQFYAYVHSLLDGHVDRVLQALEDSGQAENTIVVFLTDHGEYAAAHGMLMEKWHAAYQEALHVPVVVQFPPSGDEDTGMRQIDDLTSHIDILPTVLGLAGIGDVERERIASKLAESRPVPPLPGVNLAPLIRGEVKVVTEPDGQPRKGVLFITDDEITLPLPPSAASNYQEWLVGFEVFNETVESVRKGTMGKGPVPELAPGPVCQPNRVRCVRTPNYKLSRYFDPSGKAEQEWEMYDLQNDPNETTNLTLLRATPPKVREDLPAWVGSRARLQAKADELAALLAALEKRDLEPVEDARKVPAFS